MEDKLTKLIQDKTKFHSEQVKIIVDSILEVMKEVVKEAKPEQRKSKGNTSYDIGRNNGIDIFESNLLSLLKGGSHE